MYKNYCRKYVLKKKKILGNSSHFFFRPQDYRYGAGASTLSCLIIRKSLGSECRKAAGKIFPLPFCLQQRIRA